MIGEALAEARRRPHALSMKEVAEAHRNHAIILLRRGMLVRAMRAAHKAIQLWTTLLEDATTEEQKADALREKQDTQLQLAEILERLGKLQEMDEVEAELGGLSAVRPSAAARC